jgi:hypothetical protein
MARLVGRLVAAVAIALSGVGGAALETAALPRPTTLTVLPVEPEPVGRRPLVTVHLADDLGAPLGDQVVTLEGEAVPIRRARTTSDGSVVVSVGWDLAVGHHEVRVAFAGSATAAAAQASARITIRPIVVTIDTVPPTPGIPFALDGLAFESDGMGRARIDVAVRGTYLLEVLLEPDAEISAGTRARFARWSDEVFQAPRVVEVRGDMTLQAGFALSHAIAIEFVDLSGAPVPKERITSIELSVSNGAIHSFADGALRWLPASRVQRRRTGLEVTPLQYSVTHVGVDGANVVNRCQQRYYIEPDDVWQVELLLYGARIRAIDALFGTPVGSGVQLTYPDGRSEFHAFDVDGSVSVGSLARGVYRAQVVGVRGMAPLTPIALSREQEVELKVLTALDIGLSLGLGAALALGLLFHGRPHLIVRSVARSLLVAALLTPSLTVRASVEGSALRSARAITPLPENRLPTEPQRPWSERRAEDPIPLMAYYYIWFEARSWERAKTDVPLVGRYSSDDRRVMTQHVRWAKEAGIDGFIVSWKSTLPLDRRLEQLIDVAEEEGFWLWIMYQGLDVQRDPQPIERVDDDIGFFLQRYGWRHPFGMLGLPVLILSGSWAFQVEEIAALTAQHGQRLHLLASERNVDGFRRIADLVDGNAYYWSSVNPDTFAAYEEKLAAMAEAVHAAGGFWVAPAAPGFDARLVGGATVVERSDGTMLRRQLDAATRSSPDAVAIISWNEFSENTHIEPSVLHGARSLEVVADRHLGLAPQIADFDSSEPGDTNRGGPHGVVVVAGLFVFIAASIAILVLRISRTERLARGEAVGATTRDAPSTRWRTERKQP